MDRQKTGALIAQRRRELGLTQKQLAERLHISDRTVSKWERGAGFPDTGMLVPLAESLALPVLDLLRGERAESDTVLDSDAAVRETLDHVGQARRKRPISVRSTLQLVGCMAVLLVLLSFFGLIFLPVNRTQTAMVYRDGETPAYTMVQWKGRLLYRLPWFLEFRGQIRTPLAQTTLDPEHQIQTWLTLDWDRTSFVRHTSWFGNIHAWEGPFVENKFYVDWWGKEFAFSLSDGSIVATSREAYNAFQTWISAAA